MNKLLIAAKILLKVCLFFALLSLTSVGQAGPTDTTLVEQGSYVLYKLENPIGEESYRILKNGDSLSVEMTFAFTDRGTRVPINATYRCDKDLNPSSFAIKGRTSRQSRIDDAVEVTSGKIRIRKRETWSEIAPPAHFFPIAGYAPTAMQMLLVRFWAGHETPGELESVLGGTIKIEPRGKDTIMTDGDDEILNRYSVAGLIWGRETIWFDSALHLVAAVTTDAEFDHFEAVQEQYKGALGTFVSKAGADGMAVLSEMAKTIGTKQEKSIALVGGTLVDGTGAPPVPDAVIIIENGRIKAAGPRPRTPIPAGAYLVQARGKTFLPGLWDMHAHFEQVEWGPIYLAAGVTTVRDCGNELEFITSVRDAIAAGKGIGPRILAAGIVDGSSPTAIGVERVDTPEDALLWTDRYHEAGFQQMKIYSSVKLRELNAVADEAHRLGMTVTGHVPDGLTVYQVVEAGQDQISHLHSLFPTLHTPSPADSTKVTRLERIANIDVRSPEVQKLIAFLKERGTVLDPTLVLTELNLVNTEHPATSFEPGVAKLPPPLAAGYLEVGPPSPVDELLRKLQQMELGFVGALHKAGVPIVAGTDQAVPGHSLHREIELYVQAGFTPMEAIQAATIVPARVMGLEKELGSIEVGKRADIIVVNGNPLEDVHNSRNVEVVISNGVIYNPGELWQSVGFKP